MEILFETDRYWVVRKPAGMVSEPDDGRGLSALLATQNDGYAGVIHRLDREVEGVTIFAKTPDAAAWLSGLAGDHLLQKEYLAAVAGVPEAKEGELRDLLFYDRTKNKTFVAKRTRRGVKEAILRYRVLAGGNLEGIGTVSLLSIELMTGRTHQIRAQFAARGLPVIGDRRYGGPALPSEMGSGKILLACRKLSFPENGIIREFSIAPNWAALFD